jgi:hypothetical protein
VFERADPSDETSELRYMEITNKMFVRPTTVSMWDMEVPSCILLQFMDGNPVDCAASEITVRSSFLRVEDRDYQPNAYSGDRMDRFGYFITERPGYDPSYGLIEPIRYRFANRHNLWMASHKTTEDGALVSCVEDADCDDGRGSKCDLDLGRARRALNEDGRIEGACTIPYRDREIRPVVYYTSSNFPADLMPEMRMLEEQWNGAFVGTVSSLRENECLANGGTDCAAERAREDHQQMFVVCESPVPEGAPEACGPAGTVARIGDLRRNLIGYVNEPHRSSPLGYGPSAADPVTGEIVMANAFVYGAGVDTYATLGRDIVALLNGDLSEADIASGAPVDAWVARMSDAEGVPENQHVVPVSPAEIERLNAAMDFSHVRSGASRAARGAPASPGDAVTRVRESMTRLATNTAFGRGVEQGQAALERLEGTDIERLMVSRDARAMAGIDPNLPVDDAIIAQASPLRAMRVDQRAALDRARARLQESAGLDYGEFVDEGLLGLARAISRAVREGGAIEWHGVEYDVTGSDGGIDYDAVRDMLRHPIMAGLTLHEVGHTLGLRHNFSGSFDAVNYSPRYWELRDDGSMRPRLYDPMTEAEHDGRITEHAYSTVMDYGQNFVVTDAAGIGHYDHAAIKMGYGDLVEVFEEVPDTTEMAWFGFIQNAGWPVPLTLEWATGGNMSAYTYTDVPGLAGGVDALERRVDVPYTSLHSEGLLERSGIDYPTEDDAGRIAVPYRFCSDEQADLNPGCYRYDSGADAYESVQSVIDSYWSYYIFNNFRRRRIGFDVSATASRIQGRYFEKLQRANQTYALYRGVFQDAFGDSPGYAEFWTAERGMGGFTAAVGSAYQTLLRVVTAPEPGRYGTDMRGDGTLALLPGGVDATIDGYDGRYLETTWDFDAGYFWFDQLERVGYFYDKILAIEVLTDPTTHFLGRDTDADIRRYQINFASTFGPSMTRFFGGILGEDWATIAPRIQSGAVVYPDPIEIELGSMPGTPLAPNASFSIQLYATVFGMTYIPQTYDQEYLNESRVWVRGGAEEVEIDPSVPTVEFTDATSGLTYVAVSDMDGTVERGVGAQLIERARNLQTRADGGDEVAAAELDSFVDNLDLARHLTWYLGFGAQP